MPFCTNCGAENPRENKFCSECGSPLTVIEAPTPPTPPIFTEPEAPAPAVEAAPEQPVYAQPAYTQPGQPSPIPQPAEPQFSAQATFSAETPQYVAPVATGGLLAWSIVSLLLCLIPGIVALVQTLGINKCATVEEQQKKMKNARIWCIVSTVLGILSVIGQLANR